MTCSHTPLVETQVLDEMYYKDMMHKLVPGWLPHRDYSQLIPYVKFQRMTGDTMEFFVPNKYNGWMVYVKFDEWNEQVADMELKPVDAARLLYYGANLRLHCGCPSFLFHGFNYILTQTDSAIVPEKRFPHVRNPQLKGMMCKHLRRVMLTLPFHLGDLARAIKDQRVHHSNQ